MSARNRYLLFVVAAILCFGYGVLPSVAHAQEDVEDSPFSFEALGNLTYWNEHVEGGAVTLVDGIYAQGDPEPSAESPLAVLTGFVAYGDLTGDEAEDAAALLVTDAGESGLFVDLAVVIDDQGVLTNVATITLGDQVNISGITIDAGQILVDMIVHGPDDPMCCPTQPVLRAYALGEDGLTLVSEAQEDITNTASFSPESEPSVGTLYMGAEEQFWLDPMLVSVHTGAMSGPGVQASTLGTGCAGVIDSGPEFVVQWSENKDVDVLRIFLLSLGDPTLVVVTPDGDILCNDDYNPLVLDSYLEIENPVGGRYAVYAGSFESNASTPGFLVVTTEDLSPATMDLAQMFPRQIAADAVGEPLSLDTLEISPTLALETITPTLTITNTPFVQEMSVGGALGAYNIELGNDLCTGFIGAAPTFAFDWEGEAEKLVLFFEGEADTTLVVRDPNGTFQCNDDIEGAQNLNPYLDLTPIPGRYLLWVGSFAPDEKVDGSLTIAGTTELRPQALTPDMIGE